MPEVSTEAGFSLVELMIALAVAAIIAAFAIPSYQNHLQRSFLPEASSGLQLSALRLEQFYQDRRSYRDGAGACGVALPAPRRFAFNCIPAADGQAFLLTATGVEQDTMRGFAFTLDERGNANTTALPDGWGAAPQPCWVTRRGGGC